MPANFEPDETMTTEVEFCAPKNLAEALEFLALNRDKKTWILAGGTDIMPAINSRQISPLAVLDIWGLRELRILEQHQRHLTLGPLTTFSEMMQDPRIGQTVPLLREAAQSVGAVQIQNRGTLGGNIANASPAGDVLPVLAVHNAVLELRSAKGSRNVEFNAFYSGYKQSVLKPDELIYRIHVPIQWPQQIPYWRKLGTRQAQAISKVAIAAIAEVRGGILQDIRIGLGAVAPTVVRAKKTEDTLRGRRLDNRLIQAAGEIIQSDICPIDDIRSTARFRRRTTTNILRRFLSDLKLAHRGM